MEYHASSRHEAPGSKPKRIVQHCLVMSRSVEQFESSPVSIPPFRHSTIKN
jgi:hypothetical protein